MKVFRTIAFAAALCGSIFTARAAQDSTGIYVRAVLKPATEGARSTALQRLAALATPASYPFLEAVNGSNLYVLGDKAVTLGKDSAVYEVYPDERLLPMAPGELSGLVPVVVGRADRLLLSSLSAWLELFNADAEHRAMAYGQLPDTSGPAGIAIIVRSLAAETDPEALRAGREKYYAFELNNATGDHIARAYIDSLRTNKGEDATRLLRDYAKRGDRPEATKNYALEAAQALDLRYLWLQRIQNVFSGLSLGSILILVSLGLAIVYGLAGIINMAHGEFLMIGAYTTYSMEQLFTNVLHVHDGNAFFIAALPASFLVAGGAGLLLERFVIRKLYSKPLESLLATWGVSLILIQTARTIFGDLTAVKIPPMLSGGWALSPHLVLPHNRIFVMVLTTVVVAGLYWTLQRTRLGLQIRSVTQNRAMSACLGINTRRVDAMTFFIGSGLAGLAGCAMTLIGNVVPDMGQTYIVDSFLVVVTGGVGKLAGTVVAGLGIGLFSKVLEAFFEAVYGKVLILLVIMLFLQFKPKGLFPDKGRMAED
ncbi:MAG TPA: urea ABC transporter permease subunit UrtB [Puia sp.]|nr:urea ABC transporter permease subunit UrtB [Puia sp.]